MVIITCFNRFAYDCKMFTNCFISETSSTIKCPQVSISIKNLRSIGFINHTTTIKNSNISLTSYSDALEKHYPGTKIKPARLDRFPGRIPVISRDTDKPVCSANTYQQKYSDFLKNWLWRNIFEELNKRIASCIMAQFLPDLLCFELGLPF